MEIDEGEIIQDYTDNIQGIIKTNRRLFRQKGLLKKLLDDLEVQKILEDAINKEQLLLESKEKNLLLMLKRDGWNLDATIETIFTNASETIDVYEEYGEEQDRDDAKQLEEQLAELPGPFDGPPSADFIRSQPTGVAGNFPSTAPAAPRPPTSGSQEQDTLPTDQGSAAGVLETGSAAASPAAASPAAIDSSAAGALSAGVSSAGVSPAGALAKGSAATGSAAAASALVTDPLTMDLSAPSLALPLPSAAPSIAPFDAGTDSDDGFNTSDLLSLSP